MEKYDFWNEWENKSQLELGDEEKISFIIQLKGYLFELEKKYPQ